MKRIIKKIVGALILILFFGFLFITDVIEHGLFVAVLSWIFVLVVVLLLILAIHFLFED